MVNLVLNAPEKLICFSVLLSHVGHHAEETVSQYVSSGDYSGIFLNGLFDLTKNPLNQLAHASVGGMQCIGCDSHSSKYYSQMLPEV